MAIYFFGISSGISFFFVTMILLFKLSHAKVALSIIGMFAFVGLPYNLRFFFPFLVNNLKIPYFSKKFEQQKAWGVFAQIASSICFVALGFIEVENHLLLSFIIAFLSSLFSAIQDIVSESYRFQIAGKISHESSASLQAMGFRTGQFLSATIPIFASFLNLAIAHIIVVIIKIITIFFILKFKIENKENKSLIEHEKIENNLKRILKEIIVVFRNITSKQGVKIFVISIFLLRIVDTVTGAMQTILLGKIGLTFLNFGLIKCVLGGGAIFGGIFISSFLAKRVEILKVIFLGAIGEGLASLLSIYLLSFNSVILISFITLLQDFFQGFMNTLLVIYISLFCEKKMEIYHFTIFSTISSMSRTISTWLLSSFSNVIGWSVVFCLPIMLCLPITYLLIILQKKSYFTKKREFFRKNF